ncbi:uncharacterized protein L201_006543 [Kwoniella dendrophila CBS 6074]|uniref:Uncharacterized protein n=1 Tax=Kwoniella dendrophila CBS 6074 TaxID=1295534 RepID=A0AAX4K234_9TREE
MAFSTLASSSSSSSRVLLSIPSISKIGSTRGVLHRARPPRIPILHSPQEPKKQLPTSGTSHSIDPKINPSLSNISSNSSIELEDSPGLTFHYSPPSSLPNYTNGELPQLLKWLNQKQSIQLTGEEKALNVGKEKILYNNKLDTLWSEEQINKMIELRNQGKSRKEIGDALQLPKEQHRLISRVAPQTSVQKASKLTELEEQKATWGYRKKLARATREKRKEFW